MSSRGPESSAQPVDQLASPRIVVGVSDPRALAIVRRALGRDFELVERGDGASVLAAATAEPRPVLILLDAAEPHLRAWEVCESLRERLETRRTPILVLIERKEWRRQAPKVYECGAADHIRRPFDEATLGARVATQLELARLRDLAVKAPALDPTTDVADRRSAEEYIELEWKRAAREATPLSLVLARVDELQSLVEEQGKAYVEECLRRIAAELATIIRRPMDFLGRWGDDEFAVVLPVTEGAGATYLAELMRQGVETLTMLHPRSTVSSFVTLSLGVATTVPFPDSTPEVLISAARHGVERAARGGGNRVVAVEPR